MEEESIQIRIDRSKVPLGIRFLQWVQKDRDKLYRCHIFVLTFFAYASYHLSRKPISVVKDVLNGNCTGCDEWPPFGGKHGESLLGYLDLAFLAAYALGMYGSGYLAEHMNIRYFLTIGMLLSGAFSIMFGLGYFFKIHNLSYYIIAQLLAGLAQSSGWPAVVEAIGNWFGKGQRGLIMGIWNSHTSVGNIVGSAIAAVWADDAWGWSFIIPGCIIIGVGILVFLFLVLDPAHVDCNPPQHHLKSASLIDENGANENSGLLNTEHIESELEYRRGSSHKKRGRGEHGADSKAVSFFGAFLLPGVMEYSLCLFFAKLVSYTFLYWLPFYISHTPIGNVTYSSDKAGDLSTFFDVGGIIGGILAGVISDATHCSGITCVIMLLIAGPSLYIYRFFSNKNLATNISLMIISGIFVNGPYGLITTAVSANLGTQRALKGDTKALATVTAIIDGTGSLGAAIGPLLTSVISQNSWNDVYYMLITANILAALLLARQVVFECRRYILKIPMDSTSSSNA